MGQGQDFVRYLFVISMMLLTGCTASMVSTRGGSNSSYAPTNENQRPGGLIKYLNQGASSVIKSRRENAYKQMFEYCSGNYRIIREGQEQEGGAAIPVGGMVAYEPTRYWYLDFECEKQITK
jgi:hypothetical protein